MTTPTQEDSAMKDLSQKIVEELSSLLAHSKPKEEAQWALQAALRRLNLVTREEFDAQAQVLQRTREKLEALEAQVAEMETRPAE